MTEFKKKRMKVSWLCEKPFLILSTKVKCKGPPRGFWGTKKPG